MLSVTSNIIIAKTTILYIVHIVQKCHNIFVYMYSFTIFSFKLLAI